MNESGTVTATYKYDAWGNLLSYTGGGAALANPFRYRSYYYDIESGFYYLNSRYYDPVVGRFINADGILGANGDINAYNLFAYCSNNPIAFSDPSGSSKEKEQWEKFKSIINSFDKILGIISKFSKSPSVDRTKKALSKAKGLIEIGDRAIAGYDIVTAPRKFYDTREAHAYNVVTVGTGFEKDIVGDFSSAERGKYIKRCKYLYTNMMVEVMKDSPNAVKDFSGRQWDSLTNDEQKIAVDKMLLWDRSGYLNRFCVVALDTVLSASTIVY